MTRPQFQPEQARAIARAFEATGVDYLFIGKSGAVLLGFPSITQDVDVFVARSPENGRRIVDALRGLGFRVFRVFRGSFSWPFLRVLRFLL